MSNYHYRRDERGLSVTGRHLNEFILLDLTQQGTFGHSGAGTPESTVMGTPESTELGSEHGAPRLPTPAPVGLVAYSDSESEG